MHISSLILIPRDKILTTMGGTHGVGGGAHVRTHVAIGLNRVAIGSVVIHVLSLWWGIASGVKGFVGGVSRGGR